MTKEFKQICMRSECDYGIFTVWKSDRSVKGTPCPKCGYEASLLRVPEKCETLRCDEVSPQLEPQ